MEFVVIYNGNKQNKEVFQTTIPSEEWAEIQKALDLNKFNKLDEVYGCPDCNDGGAEWLEWKTDSSEVKRVTFEFYKSPKEIEKVVDLLRIQTERISKEFLVQN